MPEYRNICGVMNPYDCSNMLLDATHNGGDLPPLPPELQQLLEAQRGGSAALYLKDMQADTVTTTAQTSPAPTTSPGPSAGELSELPLPFLLIAAGGLAWVGIKAAVERFNSSDDDLDSLDRELEAWEKQLGTVEPAAYIEPQAKPAAASSPPNPISLIELPQPVRNTFDWPLLRDSVTYPHLLILGKTGAGKTTLARRVITDWGGQALVITPHCKPGEWGELKVEGAGRNYAEIGRAIAGLVDEMTRRYRLYSSGIEDYPTWSIVIDEVPAIMANCPDAGSHLKELAREARKVKMRLLVLSQGDEVKTLGIEGEGSVRESFTRVLLRGFIEKLPESVRSELGEYPYPCLVNGVVADIDHLPDLPIVEPLQDDCSPAAATTAQRLEAIYSGPAMEPQRPNNGDNGPTYTPDNLSHQQAVERIQQLKQSRLSQTKIIETLWGVKAGSNRPYETARAEYKTITGE